MLNIRRSAVSTKVINSVYNNEVIKLDARGPINSYMILQDTINPKHTAFIRHVGNGLWQRIESSDKLIISGLRGRDAGQSATINNLINKKILINTIIGAAGTGKTTLALAYALDRWFNDNKKIVLSKPTITVGEGKAFGPVPGDVEEKYAPYLASYEIAIKRLLGKNSNVQLDVMKRKNQIEYVPIELIRGSEFENCTFILDEAQNLTWHELKTIISLIREGAKIIILGDLHQIDISFHSYETGLYKLINSIPYQNASISSQIELLTQYRSPITQLVTEVDGWLKQSNKD